MMEGPEEHKPHNNQNEIVTFMLLESLFRNISEVSKYLTFFFPGSSTVNAYKLCLFRRI